MVLDVSPVCRICLSTKASKDITDLKSPQSDKTCFGILLFCLGIQVEEDSKLGTKLCQKCLNKIKNFYDFKKLAIMSDAYLRRSEPVIIKRENGLEDDRYTDILLPYSDNADIEIQLSSEIKLDSIKYEEEEPEIPPEVKDESSDDELLSNIRRIKYEFIPEGAETEQNGDEKMVSIPKRKCECDNTVHVCSECGKHWRNLNAHRQVHTLNNNPGLRTKCDLCSRTFTSSRSLNKHRKFVHVVKKTNCPFCDKAVKNLKSHIILMHQMSESRHECQHCGKLFASAFTRDMHLANRPTSCYESEEAKNNGQKPEPKPKLVHPECSENVVNLEKHSDSSKSLPCSKCNRIFSCDSARCGHIKKEHIGKVKLKPCPFCKKAFKDLKTHVSTMHQQSELPHECRHCGKRFLTKSVCEKHMIVHSDARPHTCDVCDKAYRTINLLKRHKKQVHENPNSFLCHHCSKFFNSEQDLKRHVRSHTEDNRCRCVKCGKWFAAVDNLREHMLTHSTEKPFACKMCDKKFTYSGYLSKHMVTHTSEKRYQCSHCDKKFHRSDHRTQHEAAVHKVLLAAHT